ncbi:Antitoxin Phd_YefM, type II toxin-antitoxin system [Burkholderia sp. D7]|nr:Antitoxin Phd_YefM, type II toxin-antitoxin system [Burkholderia sp. D7]
MKPSNIKPASYLKSDAARIVTELMETHEPLTTTQDGEAKLVVRDIHIFERQRQTNALLHILALGQTEIAEGKFSSATDVFAELDCLDEKAME